ncbi:MAG: Bacterial type secretion system protein domain protein, partial [Marmoricola sp.]|nr:Bacterial type secretion system protein domain protein [Marmoricola sp.]
MTGPPVATVLAAVLAGISVALLVPGAAGLRPGPARSRARLSRALLLLVGATGVLVLWTWLSLHGFLLVVLVGLAVLGVARLLRRRRAARLAEMRSEQVLGVCDALASDLAAGQPPLRSLDRAAAEWPELAPVAAAAHMGADVPAVLRRLSAEPGARQLRTLAATWQVA